MPSQYVAKSVCQCSSFNYCISQKSTLPRKSFNPLLWSNSLHRVKVYSNECPPWSELHVTIWVHSWSFEKHSLWGHFGVISHTVVAQFCKWFWIRGYIDNLHLDKFGICIYYCFSNKLNLVLFPDLDHILKSLRQEASFTCTIKIFTWQSWLLLRSVCMAVRLLDQNWNHGKSVTVGRSIAYVESSRVARSLVFAGHLLYASPLALCLCVLRARLHDKSGMNIMLWPGTCLARPVLRYAIGWKCYLRITAAMNHKNV